MKFSKTEDLMKNILRCKEYHYDALGVTKTASIRTIITSYKCIARQIHPDKNNSPMAGEAFKIINYAKCILLDDWKRKEYDRARAIKDINLVSRILSCKNSFDLAELTEIVNGTSEQHKEALELLLFQLTPTRNVACGVEKAFQVVTDAYNELKNPSKPKQSTGKPESKSSKQSENQNSRKQNYQNSSKPENKNSEKPRTTKDDPPRAPNREAEFKMIQRLQQLVDHIMRNQRNYYELLRIQSNATSADIQTAFHQLLILEIRLLANRRKLANPEVADVAYNILENAFKTLQNQHQRNAYDRLLFEEQINSITSEQRRVARRKKRRILSVLVVAVVVLVLALSTFIIWGSFTIPLYALSVVVLVTAFPIGGSINWKIVSAVVVLLSLTTFFIWGNFTIPFIALCALVLLTVISMLSNVSQERSFFYF